MLNGSPSQVGYVLNHVEVGKFLSYNFFLNEHLCNIPKCQTELVDKIWIKYEKNQLRQKEILLLNHIKDKKETY